MKNFFKKTIWERLWEMDKELSDQAGEILDQALATMQYDDVKDAIIAIYKQGFREGIGVTLKLLANGKDIG